MVRAVVHGMNFEVENNLFRPNVLTITGKDVFDLDFSVDLVSHAGEEQSVIDAFMKSVHNDGTVIHSLYNDPNSPVEPPLDDEGNVSHFSFTDARFDTFKDMCENSVPADIAVSAAVLADENVPCLNIVDNLRRNRCAVQIDRKVQDTTLGIYCAAAALAGPEIVNLLFSEFGSSLERQREVINLAQIIRTSYLNIEKDIPRESLVPTIVFIRIFSADPLDEKTILDNAFGQINQTLTFDPYCSPFRMQKSVRSRYLQDLFDKGEDQKSENFIMAVMMNFLAGVPAEDWRGILQFLTAVRTTPVSLPERFGQERMDLVKDVFEKITVDMPSELLGVIMVTGGIDLFLNAYHDIDNITQEHSSIRLSTVLAVYNYYRDFGMTLPPDVIISLAGLPTDMFEVH